MLNIGPYRKAIMAAIPVVVWAAILVIRIGNPEFAEGVDQATVRATIKDFDVLIGSIATVAAPVLTYLVPNKGFVKL